MQKRVDVTKTATNLIPIFIKMSQDTKNVNKGPIPSLESLPPPPTHAKYIVLHHTQNVTQSHLIVYIYNWSVHDNLAPQIVCHFALQLMEGCNLFKVGMVIRLTLMCLSIGTPKNNKFSICSKWKIHNF